MNDLDSLRTGLEHVAAEVVPADLHARILASSRRLARRRAAAGVAAGCAAVAVVSAVVVNLRHGAAPQPGPGTSPPATLHSTVLPRYEESPPPGLGPFGNVTITVPSWGAADGTCVTGRVKITNGQYYRGPGTPPVNVLSYVATDVDGDGTVDYVAHLACGEGPESPGQQIVAFRRTGTQLVPIGRVVGTQDGLAMMDEMEVRGAGRIAVLVAGEYTDAGERFVPNQWRVYGWQGGQFRQVAGPTSFPAHPGAAALSIRSSALTLHRAASGYSGDLTVTVGNAGTLDVAQAQVDVFVPVQVRPAGDGWTGCTIDTGIEATVLRCAVADLTAGSTRQLRFGFVATTPPTRTDDPIGPDNHDHYVSVRQQPPYVYEHDTDVLETTFPVVVA